MFEALLAVHIIIAIALVVLVLLNQGKGADMGAAFGSGASSTVFGSRGAATFMTKLIATLGTTFFVTSLGLAVIASRGLGGDASIIGDDPEPTEVEEERDPEEPDAPERPDAPGVPDDDAAPEAPGDPVEAPAQPDEEETD